MKQDKKELMKESAKKLFLQKGLKETSVQDITKDAGVAKGTFYVYFKDKNTLILELVSTQMKQISCHGLSHAMQKVENQNTFWWAYFMEYVITYLEEHRDVLELIHRCNLEQQMEDVLKIQELREQAISTNPVIMQLMKDGYPKEEALLKIGIAFETITTVLYTTLFLKQNVSTERIRPLLLKMVSSLFEEESL